MSKEDGEVTRSLLEQFRLIFDMYEEAIDKIPETQWRSSEIDYLIPARLILHAIEVGDFYTSPSPESYAPSEKLGTDASKEGFVWDLKPENLPSREVVLEYHREVRINVEGWLIGMSEENLLGRENKFPWTGSTRFGRALYLFGYYRQHFGEVNGELRRRGLPRIKWRTLRSKSLHSTT